MNPWTKKEIEAASILYPTIGAEEALKRFEMFGPTARICFSFTETDIEIFRMDRESGTDNMDMDMLKKMINPAVARTTLDDPSSTDAFGSLSHKIVLIRRPSIDSSATLWVVDFMSETIVRDLLLTFERKDTDMSLDLWRYLSKLSKSGAVSTGPAFEAYVHRQFRQKKFSIILQPMEKKRTLYHMQPIDDDNSIRIRFSPKETIVYKKQEILKVKKNVYYQPIDPHQVGIDSFLLKRGTLYLFQHTVAGKHDVKEGLYDYLMNFLRPPIPEEKWCFVFLIPDALDRFTASPHDKLDHLPFYTAKISVG